MRHLIVVLLVVNLLALPTLAQSGPAAPSVYVLAVLVEGNPNTGGRILAVSPLEAPASGEIQHASYVVLRVGARRFVFDVGRIASVGSLVGSTRVRLHDGSPSLADAAALLSKALTGRMDLVVLTLGTLNAGVVKAVIPVNPGRGPARVPTQGATEATIFQGGRETTVVLEPGRAGPTLVVDGSERGSECRFCDGVSTPP